MRTVKNTLNTPNYNDYESFSLDDNMQYASDVENAIFYIEQVKRKPTCFNAKDKQKGIDYLILSVRRLARFFLIGEDFFHHPWEWEYPEDARLRSIEFNEETKTLEPLILLEEPQYASFDINENFQLIMELKNCLAYFRKTWGDKSFNEKEHGQIHQDLKIATRRLARFFIYKQKEEQTTTEKDFPKDAQLVGVKFYR